MKRATTLWAILALAAGGLTGCVTTAGAYYEVSPRGSTVAVGAFYDTLLPYGEWIWVEGYGRVWRPSENVVGAGFRPYATGGQWVYTDYGWSFETDWDWGWAPFHYGRWFLEPAYGWVWMPDAVWAPAWVTWRFGGGFVGWAPLPPFGTAVVIERFAPAWCFVPVTSFVYPHVHNYLLPPANFHAAFSATTAVSHQVTFGGARWYAGPPVQHVAAAVGRPIRPVPVTPPPPGAVRPVRAIAVGQAAPGQRPHTPMPGGQPGAHSGWGGSPPGHQTFHGAPPMAYRFAPPPRVGGGGRPSAPRGGGGHGRR